MIVKVQVSIGGPPATLVYDEDHTVCYERSREFGDRLLGEEAKGFFHAKRTANNGIQILNKAKWQDW